MLATSWEYWLWGELARGMDEEADDEGADVEPGRTGSLTNGGELSVNGVSGGLGILKAVIDAHHKVISIT